jgi:hypothetical protein
VTSSVRKLPTRDASQQRVRLWPTCLYRTQWRFHDNGKSRASQRCW